MALREITLFHINFSYCCYFYKYTFLYIYLYSIFQKGVLSMRFTCEKSMLVAGLNITGRTVAQKSALSALEGILCTAGNNLSRLRMDFIASALSPVGRGIIIAHDTVESSKSGTLRR